MAIHLPFKKGSLYFLRKRTTTYLQISSGTCEDSGNFPIANSMACQRAAHVLGYDADEVRMQNSGAATAVGCRVEATNPKNQGRGAVTSTSGHGSLCSNKSYPLPPTGFMTSAEVRKRIQQVDFQLAKSKAACKKSDIPCAVLWGVSAMDLYRRGLATSFEKLQPLRAYVEYSGCDWVVSKALAQEWKDLKLAPFWTQELSMQRWQLRWEMAEPCTKLDLAQYSTGGIRAKCEGMPGLLNNAGLLAFERSKDFNGPGVDEGGVFRSAYDLFLQTFGPRLVEYRPPYDAAYVGLRLSPHRSPNLAYIHSCIASLRTHWPHMRNVFVAGVRPEVLVDIRYILGSQFSVTSDGIQVDQGVEFLLDEYVGLASAAVLIGDFRDVVFRLALTINGHLHVNVSRQQPWCFNFEKNKVCG